MTYTQSIKVIDYPACSPTGVYAMMAFRPDVLKVERAHRRPHPIQLCDIPNRTAVLTWSQQQAVARDQHQDAEGRRSWRTGSAAPT